ncbi:two-component system response regulator HydG [Pelomonas saccharophila]|uniref:Two-component system response regulator HydG n=1 Tax=Roseateles saccharophilus TaxID=304 RepID=A0ABU1YSV9_ROSSA|nr:sigma-54 dependent transcriptional regulator [Roseateles saccharophilus]MDR7271927.1 two-component system response regulator HydG [Roseateles saccharophilus]
MNLASAPKQLPAQAPGQDARPTRPLQDALGAIVGPSPSLCALRARLPMLARSNCSVLITGETGTGKDCVARALHELGERRSGPMVSINCAALPDTLLDSELFGYERGAFTGAHAAYPGKISLASGGTLFLDEIGDMPLHAQAKLLRVIETREVFPIGAMRSRHVDVRIVAATHCALEQAVRSGAFRADLFYRLNVARVELLPLRQRPEDVAALFEHFAGQLKDGAGPVRVTPSAMALMQQHDWPGNARELRNLVEAAGLVFDGRPLEPAELPLSRMTQPGGDESSRVIAALERCDWNRTRAAEMLQWSRMTLYRKMKQFHIAPAPVHGARAP